MLFVEARCQFSIVSYVSEVKCISTFKADEYTSSQNNHSRKLINFLAARSINRYIDNRSSHVLDLSEKLLLCRGLAFALPQSCNNSDIRVSFDKLAFQVSREIDDQSKQLCDMAHSKDHLVFSLRSLCDKYCQARQIARMPRSLQHAATRLRKLSNTYIGKPDKGNSVILLDYSEYLSLLNAACVDDSSKFRHVSREQPKRRGRPIKNYHPLLKKENELCSLLATGGVLPPSIAKKLSPSGSRLARLYGLSKTHKPQLSMRPILSATATYNFFFI